MDADDCKRILGSRKYEKASDDLREAIANMTKLLCIEDIQITSKEGSNKTSSIEALIACRLIPLNKNPGLRPIGIGEILKRIIGKVVMTYV